MDALSVARAQAALALSVSSYPDDTVTELLLEIRTTGHGGRRLAQLRGWPSLHA